MLFVIIGHDARDAKEQRPRPARRTSRISNRCRRPAGHPRRTAHRRRRQPDRRRGGIVGASVGAGRPRSVRHQRHLRARRGASVPAGVPAHLMPARARKLKRCTARRRSSRAPSTRSSAEVPRGRVVTYGQVAAILGHPRAARRRHRPRQPPRPLGAHRPLAAGDQRRRPDQRPRRRSCAPTCNASCWRSKAWPSAARRIDLRPLSLGRARAASGRCRSASSCCSARAVSGAGTAARSQIHAADQRGPAGAVLRMPLSGRASKLAGS